MIFRTSTHHCSFGCGQLFVDPEALRLHRRPGRGNKGICVDPASVGLYFGHAGAWYRPTAVDYERTAAADQAKPGRHLLCNRCMGPKTWHEEKPNGRWRCVPCRRHDDRARRGRAKARRSLVH